MCIVEHVPETISLLAPPTSGPAAAARPDASGAGWDGMQSHESTNGADVINGHTPRERLANLPAHVREITADHTPQTGDRAEPPADPGQQTTPAKAHTRRLQNALTALVALIATGASANGMWNYFGDKFEITDPRLRLALFAFIELALLVTALRARQHRLDHGRLGIDDAAMWALATLSGVLAATDAHTDAGKFGRLVVPLVAAWLFERAMSAERSDRTGRTGGLLAQLRDALRRVNWRISPQRVLVWLRLADPTERQVAEVARARMLARITKTAFGYHTAPPGRRQTRLKRRLDRQMIEASERLGLGTERAITAELRATLATLYQAAEGTSPEAVADLSPWRGDGRRRTDRVADTDTPTAPDMSAPTRRSKSPRHVGSRKTDIGRRRGTATVDRQKTDTSTPITHTPAAVTNARQLRAKYGADLPSDYQIRKDLGWSADRTKPAVAAHRDGVDLTTTDTPKES